MADSPKNMEITRIFDAPVEKVWKAWSDAEQVKRWWGPQGFTAPVCEMHFREGGVTLVCMRAPAEYGGMELYNTWTYTKIVPMERIEFTQHFTDKDANQIAPTSIGLPPEIPFAVPHVLTFKAVGGGKTEFSVIESGYPTEQIVEMSRGGMEQCLDKLAETLK
jgi:uncharacterized protein YndB with AHSA1/START domain